MHRLSIEQQEIIRTAFKTQQIARKEPMSVDFATEEGISRQLDAILPGPAKLFYIEEENTIEDDQLIEGHTWHARRIIIKSLSIVVPDTGV
jgi:hypothetical protein